MVWAKHLTAEATSAFLVVGAIAAWLPYLAAFFAVVHYVIVIWESHTADKLRAWWSGHDGN